MKNTALTTHEKALIASRLATALARHIKFRRDEWTRIEAYEFISDYKTPVFGLDVRK